MRCLVTIVFCLIAFPADALTCRQVRAVVDKYGADAVMTWAKWNGYSEHQIDHIRKVCRI